MKIIGVYQIWSKTHTDRCYVGCAVDIKSRFRQHNYDLKHNKHHSPQLQRHYAKYGLDDLEFEVIESEEYFNENHLLAREQIWMNRFHYKDDEIPYFNCMLNAGSALGTHWSEEAKLRITGRHPSEEQLFNQSLSHLGLPSGMKGKKQSAEAIEKCRKANIGRIPWNKGKHFSEETKLNMSNVRKKIFSEGYVNSMKGKHHSEESKQNMGKGNIGKHWKLINGKRVWFY
jgi:group I intron endonuclease